MLIPYGHQAIDEDDIAAVVEVLQSNWLTTGPLVAQFEQQLATFLNAKYVATCTNGTSALHLAVLALGIGPGDVVLVPSITFVASANAVRYVGADVAFVDVESDTGLMSADTLECAILANCDKHLKAVINIHFAGQCHDCEAIWELAQRFNLFVIDDAAHAIGTSFMDSHGQAHPIGSNAFCDLTIFSFHPVKSLTTGEGGCVSTNHKEWFDNIVYLREHGITRVPYHDMQQLGFNYRLSAIHCALGVSQLGKLSQFKRHRQQIVHQFDECFANMPRIEPLKKVRYAQPVWHLYVVFIDFQQIGKSREQVMQMLREQGIGTQIHYKPLYQHSYYKDLYGDDALPGAERFFSRCLTLPLYVGLTDQQVVHITQTIGNIIAD